MCDAVEHLGSACRTRGEGPWGEREFEQSERGGGKWDKNNGRRGRVRGEKGGRRGKVREEGEGR